VVSARSRSPRNIFAAAARRRQQGIQHFVHAAQQSLHYSRLFQDTGCVDVRGTQKRSVMVRIVLA
jgi:hypothetical protein